MRMSHYIKNPVVEVEAEFGCYALLRCRKKFGGRVLMSMHLLYKNHCESALLSTVE